MNHVNEPNDKSDKRLGPTLFTRLRPEEHERLMEIVARGEHGDTPSEVIRTAIRFFIRRIRKAA